jgi:hypothetical protein
LRFSQTPAALTHGAGQFTWPLRHFGEVHLLVLVPLHWKQGFVFSLAVVAVETLVAAGAQNERVIARTVSGMRRNVFIDLVVTNLYQLSAALTRKKFLLSGG